MCPDLSQKIQFNNSFFFKTTPLKTSILFFVLSIFLVSCNDNKSKDVVVVDQEDTVLDEELRAIIATKKLTGDPSTGRTLPDIESPKAQLGMKLFFTKSLGGDFDAACVTCHHPMLGGGDDLALPIGTDAEVDNLLGPGRLHKTNGEHFDGGPTVPRNSPTTFNIAFWDNCLFHDGRVESLGKTPKMGGNDNLGIRTPDVLFEENDSSAGINLVEAQARFPVTSNEEMKNFGNFDGTSNAEVRQNLEQRLGDYGDPLGGKLITNYWLAEFKEGFAAPDGTAEELITFDNIANAIGEYESSQVFVETPWKAYVHGDDSAISDVAKRGAKLFFNTADDGGANCSSCHSGDFFTDEGFYVIGMAQIGRGKGDGEHGTEDFGRFRETQDEKDKYAFRTPSLLNVTATGPWGHAGGSATLEHAIRTHSDPQAALDNYDFSQLTSNIQTVDMVVNTQRAIDKQLANRADGVASIEDISLTDTEVAELLAFLETLTDPCVEDRECLSKWIPDENDTDPDALRLIAIDGEGNYL
ncbi:di-haem cytochrome c peroxidase [Paraglaciecola arctica BSs20135]|uniref:Di-haem cytochrome c peroxidase n=1 Tax=Paraglaciecola arctica BSs20135 TaxID=493475 RepID=K6Y6Z3_9ALTE|nr:di-haem cytochrome c peroxidase [Paraglaciecola arctica BSs20135]